MERSTALAHCGGPTVTDSPAPPWVPCWCLLPSAWSTASVSHVDFLARNWAVGLVGTADGSGTHIPSLRLCQFCWDGGGGAVRLHFLIPAASTGQRGPWTCCKSFPGSLGSLRPHPARGTFDLDSLCPAGLPNLLLGFSGERPLSLPGKEYRTSIFRKSFFSIQARWRASLCGEFSVQHIFPSEFKIVF